MHRNGSAPVSVCLAALAGFIDALVFTGLGGFFAASMSGNAARLGVGAGTLSGGEAMLAGALVLSFASGVMVASVIARAWPGRHAAPAALATLLAIAGALLAGRGLLAGAGLALAAAMGAAHLLLLTETRGLGDGAGLTGLLTRAAERLAGALMGDADRAAWLWPLLLWCGFVAGAVLGAACTLRFGPPAFWAAAAGGAALTAWLELRWRRAAPATDGKIAG